MSQSQANPLAQIANPLTQNVPAERPIEQDAEERKFGMIAHLVAFAGLTGIPFANIAGPLVVWLMKRDTMPFVDDQAKEALNFQITATIAILCCIPLMFVLVGLLLLPVVSIATLVFTILGAVKANAGEHYRYPFTLRLIK
ncbi:DUF4870 domain-containing protein [Algisphaera agarilytica]|uniref:Orotate phosphoribosyltransferase n=1 Tax=Algisphaera agarilytica TaxID=1385975 RepID=A0A7X0H7C3_9BACT|nr:DUF4870 domain-containing protein [Algisphaera agarilytica]MBB6430613.1 hypothetical protein [Algisphaera agarilytica]